MSKSDIYIVEKILDKKKVGNQIKYKIKWKKFPLSKATWEPLENLESVTDMIEEFEKEKFNKEKRISTRSKSNDNEDEEEEEESEEEINTFKNNPKNKNKKMTQIKRKRKSESSMSSDEEEEVEKPLSKSVNNVKNNNKSNKNLQQSNIIQEELQLPERGDFKYDKPFTIVQGKQHQDLPELLLLEVKWMPRKNGVTPLNSFYTNKEMKELDIFLLCKFYEERLQPPPKKNKN